MREHVFVTTDNGGQLMKCTKQERELIRKAAAFYRALTPTEKEAFKQGLKDVYEEVLDPGSIDRKIKEGR